jgi:hypothetical protein
VGRKGCVLRFASVCLYVMVGIHEALGEQVTHYGYAMFMVGGMR